MFSCDGACGLCCVGPRPYMYCGGRQPGHHVRPVLRGPMDSTVGLTGTRPRLPDNDPKGTSFVKSSLRANHRHESVLQPCAHPPPSHPALARYGAFWLQVLPFETAPEIPTKGGIVAPRWLPQAPPSSRWWRRAGQSEADAFTGGGGDD